MATIEVAAFSNPKKVVLNFHKIMPMMDCLISPINIPAVL